MDSSLVQVNWETRKKVLLSNLNTLRKKQVHTDIMLSCDGENFPAHRLVLGMSSGYFAKALHRNKETDPILPSLVLICGVKASILHSILNFIYDGTATINSNDIPELLKAGLLLEIPGLMEMGKNYTDNTFQELRDPSDTSPTRKGSSPSSRLKQNRNPNNFRHGLDQQTDVKNVAETELVHLSSDTEPEENSMSAENLLGHSSESDGDQDFEGWECHEPGKENSPMKATMKGCKRDQVCSICSKGFFKKESLKIHLETHRNASHFVCSLCSRFFKNERLFKSHMKRHLNQKPVTVNGKGFFGHTRLRTRSPSLFRSPPVKEKRRRRETVHGILTSVARGFKRDMSTLSHCSPHDATQRKSISKASDEPNPSFISPTQDTQDLERLKYSVVSFRNKDCLYCNQDFSSTKNYRQHRFTNCKVLECGFCLANFKFEEKEAYRKHVAIHQNNTTPYLCPVCKYNTDRKHLFEDHISAHSGVYRYRCPLCVFQAKKMAEIRAHSESEHPDINSNTISEFVCRG